MPIPLAVLAATSAVPAIAQGITGFQQTRRGKDILNNLQRPIYDIPSAQKDALATARTLASTNQLPNQVQAEQRLDQSTANALYNINQNAASGTEALAALTGVYSNQMGAETDLAGQGAMFSSQQNQNLINELNKFARYQDKAFSYNVDTPFQERRAEGQALVGAGMQNKYNALKDIVGVGANFMAGINAKGVSDTLGGGAAASNLTGEFDINKMSPDAQKFASSFEMSQQNSVFNPSPNRMAANDGTLSPEQLQAFIRAYQLMNR